MGKAALTAPVYISIAWSLIISYQLFTLTAVYSIVGFLSSFWPAVGEFIIPRISMVTFIHAFAWIFVLSSVIPAVILGKSRSVLLQFFLCLTVTAVAISIEDILTHVMGTEPAAQMQAFSMWFQNPLVAGLYLSAPYFFMLYLDIRARKQGIREEMEDREGATAGYVEEPDENAPETDEVVVQHEKGKRKVPQGERKRKLTFLHGASAACFLLSLAIFWFGEAIFSPSLPMVHKLVYVATLTAFGAVLLVVGFYSGSPREQRFLWQCKEEGQPESSDYATSQSEGPIRTEEAPQDFDEEPAEEEPESVQVQISDRWYELGIERYDVLHPESVVDSQC